MVMEIWSSNTNIRQYLLSKILLQSCVLHKQSIPRHQTSEVAARGLQLSPYNVINIQIISQKPLHHNSRDAREHNPRPSSLKSLKRMKVKILEVKLGENREGNVGHVLNGEATKGNENHGPQFGLEMEKTENWAGEEQEDGSEEAAAFECHQHEKGEEGGGSQKRTV